MTDLVIDLPTHGETGWDDEMNSILNSIVALLNLHTTQIASGGGGGGGGGGTWGSITGTLSSQTDLAAALGLLATLASPTFTGTPKGPTAALGTNTIQLATTAFVKNALDALIAGAPGALDTLNELATQLTTDESAAATLTTLVGTKAPLASPVFTGSPVLPAGTTGVTATAGDNDTSIATTAFVTGAVATETTRATTAEGLKAPLASPAFTGSPVLPSGTTAVTQSPGDNDTSVATTAFVTAAVAAAIAALPPMGVIVDWDTTSKTWKYNGTTITARPTMRSYDRLIFDGTGDLGAGAGPAYPSWGASQDIWVNS